jgi:hypothetical protein
LIGLYTIRVYGKGEKFDAQDVEQGGDVTDGGDRPGNFRLHVSGFCAAADLLPGTLLTWKNIGICRPVFRRK